MLEKRGSFATKCKSESPVQMWGTAEGKAKVPFGRSLSLREGHLGQQMQGGIRVGLSISC